MKKVESASCESLENPSERESYSYDANKVNHFVEKEERKKIPIDEHGAKAGGNDTSRHNAEGGEATSPNNPDNNNGTKDSTSADVEDKIIRKYLSKRMSDIGLNCMRGSESEGENAEERGIQKGDGGGNGSRGGSLGDSLGEGRKGQSPKGLCEPPGKHLNIISDSSSDGDDVPLLKTLKIEETKVRVKMGDTTGTNWPTPDFNYEPELTKRKLRLVPLEEYEDEEDINKEGFRKVYEISAFPGVFRDATGKAYDLRDKESCPSTWRLFSRMESLPTCGASNRNKEGQRAKYIRLELQK
ncbi:hypothetical protein PCYB_051300 [Plasmodium cynomolgi strain B]|uniref:Uncharacterized protein n=1 Tax=Plasmodium cynomolgi (strain B) TaxID=1120755 RepID=K6V7M0_PLACD|nr:hypothetical protein PCYB_051300 [Plasmodium cynomolgi strain B]GAB65112.1 hypothetical protein PCYB_051300 [Plasmodium cynomolgi strain B]